jgi:hypothetical protein
MAWRYLLQRLTEDGWGDFIHTELPLTNVSVTSALSATDELTATVQPSPGMWDNGKPIFEEWGTAIWAELDGDILGGGILAHSSLMGPKWSLQCIGLGGYPNGMPWTDVDGWFGVEIDPLDAYRTLWSHLQTKPWGNMGLEIPDLKTGLKIGVELEQTEYDTESGPIAFESGPIQYNWFTTHDIGSELDKLAEDAPFEYREKHWWDGDTIRHAQDIGYPRLGQKLSNLRFVVGENIFETPQIDRDGMDYASEYMILGAGSGRTMIRGYASTPTGRARRVLIEERKDIKQINQANSLAARTLRTKLIQNNIASVVLTNTDMAPISAVQPGDEILLHTDGEWEDLSIWCRVQRKTLSPDGSDAATLDLIPSDKVI